MRSLLTTLLAAVVFFPLTANATDVEGDVWGTWTRENSPYNVIGEIRVPPGSTLVIEPGILVDFKGHYKFIVDSLATLLAIGTETDSIYFTTEDTATGWHGIRFMYSDSSSQISYCRLEHGRATGTWPDGAGGAILCYYTSPTIAANTISGNQANNGGGIMCYYSNPTISSNTIGNNLATASIAKGGGIYCSYSHPTIASNTITGNSAHLSGGGIDCWDYSSPTTVNNMISGNSAMFGGGVSSCSFSTATITGNIISCNHATYGAGIYCGGSGSVISNNIISGNSAGWSGGGIHCWGSDPTISHNMITGNSSFDSGGGICCYEYASPAVSNNTITRNTDGISCFGYCWPTIIGTTVWANTGAQLYFDPWSSGTVTYCDVQGGWPGEGNINADPLFVGPEREDFHLRWRSPCIDAGVPDSLDPDGTRSDIGAFYFNQDVPGVVELYPHDTPIVIPREGGELSFDGWLFNFSGQSGRVDIWTYLFAPEIGRYGPLDLYNIRIPADTLGLNEISRYVPEIAPEGDYAFVAYIGQYPSTIVDSSYFYFTKEGEIVGVTGDWTEDNLPLDYALFQNYPNPFNATTRINYQLPVDAHVRLEVCNLLGQKVATLVDSKQQTGYKSVVWDASEVSSGLYFYKLTAGDYTETRRMMLVK